MKISTDRSRANINGNFSVTIVCLLLGLTPLRAFAESAPISKANPAAAVDAKNLAVMVNQSKLKILEADAQKRKILGSLYSITQHMKKITNEKGHLTDELIQTQDNIKSIAKAVTLLEKEITLQKGHLHSRIRALYKISGDEYFAILFSQSNPQELDETIRFLKILTDNDYHLIKSYQENVAEYKEQQKRLKAQVAHLIGIERKIKKQEKLLLVEHQNKSSLVSELDQERSQNLNRIKVLRDSSPENDEVAQYLQPSIFEKRGQLPPPTKGKVIQDFGLITDEQYKFSLGHKGWTYGNLPGEPVTAIFNGKVAFQDHVPGYGNTVVIDHGDHYYTVYANLLHVRVKTSDTVKNGQVIAVTAPSPSSGINQRVSQNANCATCGELYFEIRHFSEPEDPGTWIGNAEKKSAIPAMRAAANSAPSTLKTE